MKEKKQFLENVKSGKIKMENFTEEETRAKIKKHEIFLKELENKNYIK